MLHDILGVNGHLVVHSRAFSFQSRRHLFSFFSQVLKTKVFLYYLAAVTHPQSASSPHQEVGGSTPGSPACMSRYS